MRRVLVTGANKGIGFAIVTAILSEHEDTMVFLGARDPGRGEEARQLLIASNAGWAKRVEVVELDVSNRASVKRAAQDVAAKCGTEAKPLYGLVNNAGIGGSSASLRDVFNVNVLGMARVCEATLPLLDAEQGRIVNITSAAGPSFVATCSPERRDFFINPNVEWEELRAFIEECVSMEGDEAAFAAAGLGDGNAYGLSKACANSYTLLLARNNPSLQISACTPGFIETDMTRGFAQARGKSPSELGMKSPADGARTPMILLFGDVEGNGRYYGSDAQRSPLDRYRAPGSEPYRG